MAINSRSKKVVDHFKQLEHPHNIMVKGNSVKPTKPTKPIKPIKPRFISTMFLPVSGTIDSTPRCVEMFKRNPKLMETTTTCIESCETESRKKFGKCKTRCCLHCEHDQCINTKERTTKDGSIIVFDSVCSAFHLFT